MALGRGSGDRLPALAAELVQRQVPITLLGDFPVRCRNWNTSGGVRMGVETVLLIVILTFAGGYLLNRWDTSATASGRIGREKNRTNAN